MPTPCVLLGGDGGCTSLQWPHDWLRVGGGGASPKARPPPATAVRARAREPSLRTPALDRV